jgi:hypothetical protein
MVPKGSSACGLFVLWNQGKSGDSTIGCPIGGFALWLIADIRPTYFPPSDQSFVPNTSTFEGKMYSVLRQTGQFVEDGTMNANEQKRQNRLRLVEDHIGRSLAESEKSGELRSALNFGKPLNFGDGFSETPEELRMGFKILKYAGFVPPEVELMRDIEALTRAIRSATDEEEIIQKSAQLAHMRQKLAMSMERLKGYRI